VIFRSVGDERPYPDHGLHQRDWAAIPPRQLRLDQLVTTKRVLALDVLLDDDSTFYGDLFPHVVEFNDVLYLEDGLHRAVRAALAQRNSIHARVHQIDSAAGSGQPAPAVTGAAQHYRSGQAQRESAARTGSAQNSTPQNGTDQSSAARQGSGQGGSSPRGTDQKAVGQQAVGQDDAGSAGEAAPTDDRAEEPDARPARDGRTGARPSRPSWPGRASRSSGRQSSTA